MRIAANMANDGQLLTSWGARSHFNSREFVCRCGVCDFSKVDQILVDLLETIRLQLAKPITVVSGIRCPKHNENEGGGQALPASTRCQWNQWGSGSLLGWSLKRGILPPCA